MSTWMEPVTDRKESDVGQNSKGSYNAADLNRVGNDVAYLAERLNGYGYFPYITTPKTDWNMLDVPDTADMLNYLMNLQELRDSRTELMISAPALPADMDYLTIDGANNIEKLLVAVKTLLQDIEPFNHRCNTFYCGEE